MFVNLIKPQIKADKVSLALELRDYQDEIVDECVKFGRGVVVLATAGGKTLTMANLLERIYQSTPKKAEYVINFKKSNLDGISDIPIMQFQHTSIRTSTKEINFKPTMFNSEVTKLDNDQDVIIIKKKKKKVNTGIKSQGYIDKIMLDDDYNYDFIKAIADILSHERMHIYKPWSKFVFMCSNFRSNCSVSDFTYC